MIVFLATFFVVLFVDFIDVCSATYRRLLALLNDVFNVEFDDVSWRHLTASNTQFIIMAWQHWWSSVTHSFILIYSLGCSMLVVVFLCDTSVVFTHTQLNSFGGQRAHRDKDV